LLFSGAAIAVAARKIVAKKAEVDNLTIFVDVVGVGTR